MENTAEQFYTVLIVDDEHLARELLMDYVSKIPMLKLVATCANAMEAMSFIQQEHIDILLTDIEMPDITGVEFVGNLPYRPSIIFTTAYSQYAVSGYDLGVVDYLLKPIAFARFCKAVNKAVDRIQMKNAAQMNEIPEKLVKEDKKEGVERDYLLVKADRKFYKVNYSDLLFIEGQQEYVTFHTKHRNITAFYSLKNLTDMLPSDQFVRIHKSFIVSKSQIEIVDPNSVIVAGTELPIGPSYRDSVMQQL
ncbi:MAG: LytTR family DNA-binding domain-containing protein [Bacteroidales bacterium]|nr:LytTR family DNA-binding domain-containing protein [Bacteroidales bacterium]